jgi:helicase
MAGRAGRLGMHDSGFAVLLPENEVQFEQATRLISSPVESLKSAFLNCSLRKTVLTLIASRVAKNRDQLGAFFEGTFWWHETADKNSANIRRFPSLLDEAIHWLEENKLVASKKSKLFATQLGAAVSTTGLLPQTVVSLIDLFRSNQAAFTKPIGEWWPAVLHALCASEEFQEGQRVLPYAWSSGPVKQAWLWLSGRNLFIDPDIVENTDKVTNAVYALEEWCKGTAERSMRNMVPPVSYGQIHQLGESTAWILDGVCQVMRQPDSGIPLEFVNFLSSQCPILRVGIPSAGLPLYKAARAYAVPGVGRHRIMELVKAKLADPNDVLKADRAQVAKLLESEQRADNLQEAIAKYYDPSLDVQKVRHAARAKSSGMDPDRIIKSYELFGVDYEEAVLDLLQALPDWKVSKIDYGKRQGFPDIMISLNGKTLLLECKTKERDTATLNVDEAFAVLHKGTDFKFDHRITIGKPEFNEISKSKADGSREVTLLRHKDFVEAILRVQDGSYTVSQLFKWMMTPGYARLAQLEAIRLSEISPADD